MMSGEEQCRVKGAGTRVEMKRADKTIHKFKAALDEHAIVAITDSKGKIIYVNDKFCAISLYPQDELLGKDHRVLNSRHHPKSFFQDLWKTIQTGKVWRGEIENCRKDGTSYWVDTTIVPFLDEDGNPEQYIAIQTDVTERKKFETRLQEMAAQLDLKNQELENVIYAASHDLRSPLVNVQGFSSMIEDQVGELSEILSDAVKGKVPDQSVIDAIQGEMAGALKFIQAGASKMDTLLNGLLMISRVGTAEVQITDLDVERVVEANLAAMKFQIDQAGAEVVVGELPPARGDSDLLGQVFANLFGNAVKYASAERPLRLEVFGDREDRMVTYRVKDNGMGIAPDHLEQIFNLFYRLNPSDAQSLGMGLTIVRKALGRMSGQITVSSGLGQGSVFSISLPA